MSEDLLKQELGRITSDLQGFISKADAERKQFGDANQETKGLIEKLQKQVDALDQKLQAKDFAPNRGSLEQDLKENESLQKLTRDGKGTAVLKFKGGLDELRRKAMADYEAKTTITSSAVGSATSGVLMFDRTPGIVPAARKQLFVGDLLTRIPTSANAIDYVKVNADVAKASPQTEGSDKAENALTFTTATASVKTLATWIPATRQVLEDFAGLQSFISDSLTHSVKLEEELQILTGSGTGQNLNGLITQATAFNTSLLVAADGWKKVDMIGRAIEQVQIASETEPNFVAMNPADWWDIRLTKDDHGNYIFGPPNMPGPMEFFGLTPIPSNNVASTKFLVGNSTPLTSVIRDRMDLEIAISTEHSDYFIKNMVAIRAEERLALVVYRPAAFIYGTFNTSP